MFAKVKLGQGPMAGSRIEKVGNADRRIEGLAPQPIAPTFPFEKLRPLVHTQIREVPRISSVPLERDLIGDPWHGREKAAFVSQAAFAGGQERLGIRQVLEDIGTGDDFESTVG